MLSINPLKLTSKSLISDYYLILQKKMEAEHKVEKNKNTLYNDLFVFNNQFRKEVQGLTESALREAYANYYFELAEKSYKLYHASSRKKVSEKSMLYVQWLCETALKYTPYKSDIHIKTMILLTEIKSLKAKWMQLKNKKFDKISTIISLEIDFTLIRQSGDIREIIQLLYTLSASYGGCYCYDAALKYIKKAEQVFIEYYQTFKVLEAEVIQNIEVEAPQENINFEDIYAKRNAMSHELSKINIHNLKEEDIQDIYTGSLLNFNHLLHEFFERVYGHLHEDKVIGQIGSDAQHEEGRIFKDLKKLNLLRKNNKRNVDKGILFFLKSIISELATTTDQDCNLKELKKCIEQLKRDYTELDLLTEAYQKLSNYIYYFIDKRICLLELFEDFEKYIYQRLGKYHYVHNLLLSQNYCDDLDTIVRLLSLYEQEKLIDHYLKALDILSRHNLFRSKGEVLYKHIVDCLNDTKVKHSLFLNEHCQRVLQIIERYREPYQSAKIIANQKNIFEIFMSSGCLSNAVKKLNEFEIDNTVENEVRFIAENNLYYDMNLDDQIFRGVNIAIIAPNHEIKTPNGQCRIITDAIELSPAVRTFVNAAANGANGTTEHPNGTNGTDGENGQYGLSGGNITIIGNTLPIGQLICSAKGSQGGNGQDGGQGGCGVAGHDGNSGEIIEKTLSIKQKLQSVTTSNENDLPYQLIVDNFQFNWRAKLAYAHGIDGKPGGQGGHAGYGGAFGLGGRGGVIEYICFKKTALSKVLVPVDGKDGIPGKPGHIGRGGYYGMNGTDVYIRFDWRKNIFETPESHKDEGLLHHPMVRRTSPKGIVGRIFNNYAPPRIIYPSASQYFSKQYKRTQDGDTGHVRENNTLANESTLINKSDCLIQVTEYFKMSLEHWNVNSHNQFIKKFTDSIDTDYPFKLLESATRSSKLTVLRNIITQSEQKIDVGDEHIHEEEQQTSFLKDFKMGYVSSQNTLSISLDLSTTRVNDILEKLYLKILTEEEMTDFLNKVKYGDESLLMIFINSIFSESLLDKFNLLKQNIGFLHILIDEIITQVILKFDHDYTAQHQAVLNRMRNFLINHSKAPRLLQECLRINYMKLTLSNLLRKTYKSIVNDTKEENEKMHSLYSDMIYRLSVASDESHLFFLKQHFTESNQLYQEFVAPDYESLRELAGNNEDLRNFETLLKRQFFALLSFNRECNPLYLVKFLENLFNDFIASRSKDTVEKFRIYNLYKKHAEKIYLKIFDTLIQNTKIALNLNKYINKATFVYEQKINLIKPQKNVDINIKDELPAMSERYFQVAAQRAGIFKELFTIFFKKILNLNSIVNTDLSICNEPGYYKQAFISFPRYDLAVNLLSYYCQPYATDVKESLSSTKVIEFLYQSILFENINIADSEKVSNLLKKILDANILDNNEDDLRLSIIINLFILKAQFHNEEKKLQELQSDLCQRFEYFKDLITIPLNFCYLYLNNLPAPYERPDKLFNQFQHIFQNEDEYIKKIISKHGGNIDFDQLLNDSFKELSELIIKDDILKGEDLDAEIVILMEKIRFILISLEEMTRLKFYLIKDSDIITVFESKVQSIKATLEEYLDINVVYNKNKILHQNIFSILRHKAKELKDSSNLFDSNFIEKLNLITINYQPSSNKSQHEYLLELFSTIMINTFFKNILPSDYEVIEKVHEKFISSIIERKTQIVFSSYLSSTPEVICTNEKIDISEDKKDYIHMYLCDLEKEDLIWQVEQKQIDKAKSIQQIRNKELCQYIGFNLLQCPSSNNGEIRLTVAQEQKILTCIRPEIQEPKLKLGLAIDNVKKFYFFETSLVIVIYDSRANLIKKIIFTDSEMALQENNEESLATLFNQKNNGEIIMLFGDRYSWVHALVKEIEELCNIKLPPISTHERYSICAISFYSHKDPALIWSSNSPDKNYYTFTQFANFIIESTLNEKIITQYQLTNMPLIIDDLQTYFDTRELSFFCDKLMHFLSDASSLKLWEDISVYGLNIFFEILKRRLDDIKFSSSEKKSGIFRQINVAFKTYQSNDKPGLFDWIDRLAIKGFYQWVTMPDVYCNLNMLDQFKLEQIKAIFALLATFDEIKFRLLKKMQRIFFNNLNFFELEKRDLYNIIVALHYLEQFADFLEKDERINDFSARFAPLNEKNHWEMCRAGVNKIIQLVNESKLSDEGLQNFIKNLMEDHFHIFERIDEFVKYFSTHEQYIEIVNELSIVKDLYGLKIFKYLDKKSAQFFVNIIKFVSGRAIEDLISSKDLKQYLEQYYFDFVFRQLLNLIKEYQKLLSSFAKDDQAIYNQILQDWLIKKVHYGFQHKDIHPIKKASSILTTMLTDFTENGILITPIAMRKVLEVIGNFQFLADAENIISRFSQRSWLKRMLVSCFLSRYYSVYPQKDKSIDTEIEFILLSMDENLLTLFYNAYIFDQYNIFLRSKNSNNDSGILNKQQLHLLIHNLQYVNFTHGIANILLNNNLCLWQEKIKEIHFTQIIEAWHFLSDDNKKLASLFLNRICKQLSEKHYDEVVGFVRYISEVHQNVGASIDFNITLINILRNVYNLKIAFNDVYKIIKNTKAEQWEKAIDDSIVNKSDHSRNFADIVKFMQENHESSQEEFFKFSEIGVCCKNIKKHFEELIKLDDVALLNEIIRTIQTLNSQRDIEHRKSWIREHFIDFFGMLLAAWWLTSATDRNNRVKARDTQLYAVMLFINAEPMPQGLLQEMKTGEGKTLVVGIFAAALSLMKIKVDVLTSNRDLAESGARKCTPFYRLLRISVGLNCTLDTNVNQQSYRRDIVYGDIGSFARDVLNEEAFAKDCFAGRYDQEFSAIVDEVDSLALDKGRHVVYISHDYPMLKHLEPLFIAIWLIVIGTDANQFAEDNYDNTMLKLSEDILKLIEQNVIEIPKELHKYCKNKLPDWLQSAFYARLMEIKDNFIIDKDIKNKEDNTQKIIIMDKQTGAEEYSTQWSNGLTQFLELRFFRKHSSLNLRAVFISNKRFFSRYKKQLYGLTGTLGSKPSRGLLASVYNLKLLDIPTAFLNRYEHRCGRVGFNEASWLEEIEKEIIEINNRQPILIIVENIRQLELIHNKLSNSIAIKENCTLRTYARDGDEIEKYFETNHATVGDVIIATSKGGRGTDILVNLAQSTDGLHVIVTYLAASSREEWQALGRTARGGAAGSGCFILQVNAKEYHEEKEKYSAHPQLRAEIIIEKEKIKRDKQEQACINDMLLHGIPQLNIEELLYKCFLKLKKRCLVKLHEITIGSEKLPQKLIDFYLDKITDRWAFWFDQNRTRYYGEKSNATMSFIWSNFKDEFGKSIESMLTANKLQGLVTSSYDHISLGILYTELSKYQSAITEFDIAIKKQDPTGVAAMWAAFSCIKLNNSASLDNKKTVRRYLKIANRKLDRLRQMLLANNEGVNIYRKNPHYSDQTAYLNDFEVQTNDKLKVIGLHLRQIKELIGVPIEQESFINQIDPKMVSGLKDNKLTKLFIENDKVIEFAQSKLPKHFHIQNNTDGDVGLIAALYNGLIQLGLLSQLGEMKYDINDNKMLCRKVSKDFNVNIHIIVVKENADTFALYHENCRPKKQPQWIHCTSYTKKNYQKDNQALHLVQFDKHFSPILYQHRTIDAKGSLVIYNKLANEGIIYQHAVRRKWHKAANSVELETLLNCPEIGQQLLQPLKQLILNKSVIHEVELAKISFNNEDLWNILRLNNIISLASQLEIYIINLNDNAKQNMDALFKEKWERFSTENSSSMHFIADKIYLMKGSNAYAQLNLSKYRKLKNFLLKKGYLKLSMQATLVENHVGLLEQVDMGKYKNCKITKSQTCGHSTLGIVSFLKILFENARRKGGEIIYQHELPFNSKTIAINKLYSLLYEKNILKSGGLCRYKYTNDNDLLKKAVANSLNKLKKDGEDYALHIDNIVNVLSTNKGKVRLLKDMMKVNFVLFHDLKNRPDEMSQELGYYANLYLNRFLVIDYELSWWDPNAFVCAMLGLAQVMAGIVLIVCSSGIAAQVGAMLIAEGLMDMLYATIEGCQGSFSWNNWAQQKVISVFVCAATLGTGCFVGFAEGCAEKLLFNAFSDAFVDMAQSYAVQLITEAGLSALQATVFSAISYFIETSILIDFDKKLENKFKEIKRNLASDISDFHKHTEELKNRLLKIVSSDYSIWQILDSMRTQFVSGLQQYLSEVMTRVKVDNAYSKALKYTSFAVIVTTCLMDYFKSYTEIQNLSDAIGAIIEQECCVTSLEEIENVILSDFEKNSLTNLEKEINAFVRREFHDKILGMLRNFTFSTVASLAQYATSHATQSVKENVEKLISFTRTKANPDASLAKLRIIGEDNPIRERGTEHIVSDADAVTGIEQPSQRNNMSDMLSELEKQRALLVLDDLDLKARARVKVGDAISQIKGDRAHRVKTPMLCMHELKENIKRITSEINSYSATLHGELINLNFQYRFLEHDKKVLISKIIELIQRILLSRQVELLSQNKRASINLTLQADDEIALVSELTKILDKKTDTNNNAIDRILYCIRRYTGTPIDKQLHHKLFSQIELDITHYFQSLTRLQEVKMQNTENNNGAIQPFNFSNQVSQLMSSVTKEDMTAGVQGLFNGISQWSRNNQLGQEGMLLDKRKINGNQFIALKTIGGVFSCIQESQKTQQLQMVMMGNVLQGMLRNQAAWHAETIRMNKAREAFIRECEQWQQNFILEHITPLTQKVLELIVPFNEIKKLSSEDKQFLTDQGNTLKETARDLQNTLDKMRENRVALLGQGDEHIKLVEQLDKSNRLIVDALTSSISEVNKSNKGLLQEGFGTIKSVVESLMQAKAQVAPNANQLPPGQDPALQEQANNQAPAAQQAQTTSTHSPSNVHDAQLLSSASLAYGIFKRRYRNETMRETDETYAKQQEAKDAYKAILRQNLDAQTRAQVDKRLNKLKNPESLLRPSVQ